MSTRRTVLARAGPWAFSLVMSTLGVWFSAGMFAATVLSPILGHEMAIEMGLKPYYPLLIVFGILIGHLAWLRWRRLCTPWVWVLPSVYLMSGIISWLHAGSSVADAVHHFFGKDCWPSCQDQYQKTCPLYSSLAYSVGVVLHRLRPSSTDDSAGGV